MTTGKKAEKSLHERPLPPGWRWVKLGEICEVTWGNTSITKASYRPSGFVAFSAAGPDGFLPYYEYDREAVILSAIGARCGKCFFASNKWTAIKNTIVIYPKNNAESDVLYLYYYLDREDLWPCDSMAQPFITMAGAQSIEVPLPPLPEQHRIAAILREQMAAVEKARKAAEARLEAVNALPASFLRQVFPQPGQPLPAGWRWVKLGEVCELIMGRTPSRNVPEYWGGSLPWVSIADLNDGSITHTKETISQLGASASRSRLLPAGTILFSFKLTIGKMGIAGIDLYTNEAIVGVFPRESNQLNNDYLWYALKYMDTGEDLSYAVKGRTLNQKTLDALLIPLPPLPEQQRIAAMLREQMAAVEKARKAAEEELQTINALPAALLRRAFNGEL